MNTPLIDHLDFFKACVEVIQRNRNYMSMVAYLMRIMRDEDVNFKIRMNML